MPAQINYSGHQYLRQRLVLSILSGKSVRVEKIRSEDQNPGLRGGLHIFFNQLLAQGCLYTDYEVSLLRLLEKVTNGTVIEISATGMFLCKFLCCALTK